ncbi:protease adaptor protein RcdA [Maricaulis sp. CAU 1757]
MTDTRTPTLFPAGGAPAARSQDFAASEMFQKLFREGMDLVEETAAYLDGPGRDDAKALDRAGALSYATESMKLTTRLMQAASWLLAQRAVSEGEMSADDATDGKYRLSNDRASEHLWPDGEAPPVVLADLVARSRSLYARLKRIDDNLYVDGLVEADANPVADQLAKLRGAFGEF